MKHHHSILLGIAAALALCTACSSDATPPTPDGLVPIRLNATVGSPTRSTTTLQASGTFDANEQVRVYVSNGDETGGTAKSYVAGGYLYNITTAQWNDGTGNVAVYYPTTSSGTVRLWGVYPASLQSGSTLTVGTDQRYEVGTGTDNYTQWDFMYAPLVTRTRPAAGASVDLPFSHQMCKLNIVVKGDGNVQDEDARDATLTLLQLLPSATVTFSQSGASVTTNTADATRKDITLRPAIGDGETPSCAILPPQTIRTTTPLLRITMRGEQGATVDFTPATALTMTAGNEYTFTISIGLTEITNVTTRISDWDASPAAVSPAEAVYPIIPT